MRTSRKSFSYERKQNELKQNTALRLRVLRSVLAAGFALSPWLGASDAWAEGSMITRVNDKDKNLMQNGRADIYAEASSGNVGLNRFEQFVVGNNDIANMYFRKQDNGTALDTLVNTVTNRIDINGTVNALRNNKIGGNMYFLSPKGMVVGAGGVINAGSLTVLTSGKTFDNIAEVKKAIKENEWSLDPSASIDIHGTVNAATGIDLRAAYINVTKAADATQEPLLRTGVVFDTTVNNGLINAAVKDERLEAKLDDKGNIVIADPNDTDNANLKGDGSIRLRASADSRNSKKKFLGVDTIENTVTAKTVVGEGTSIDAVGNVDISSEATISNSTKFEQWWHFMGFTNAETTVDGNVSGADVSITSNAVTNYSYGNYANMLDVLNEGTKQFGVEFPNKLTGWLWDTLRESGAVDDGKGYGLDILNNILNQVYMPFNVTDTKAATTIGEHASIKSNLLKDAVGDTLTFVDSKGDTQTLTSKLNISANSTATNKVKVNIQPRLKQGKADLSKFFTGGLIYEENSGSAIVNIDGKLEADEAISINAAAKNVSEAALKVSQPKFYKSEDPEQENAYQSPIALAGVGIVKQDTTAEVNIGAKKNDVTINAGTELNIAATSDNSLSSKIVVETNSSKPETPSEDSASSTAVNVSISKGDAIINNYGVLTGKNVKLNAEHTLSDFGLSTSNDFDGEFTGVDCIVNSDQFKSAIDNASWLTKLFRIKSQQAAGDNVQNPDAGGAAAQAPAWNQYFDIGAAISVANVKNNAKLNLKPTSEITATGDAALTAKINIEDTNIVTSDIIAVASDKVQFGASAAVAVEEMDNTAEINAEKNDTQHSKLKAAGDVKLKAAVDQRYTRAKRLADALKAGWDDFSHQHSGDAPKRVGKIIFDILQLLAEDDATSAMKSKKVAGKAKAGYDLVKNLTGADALMTALEAFFDVSNYVNMYVASAAKGNADEDAKDATAMVSGSVGVQNLHNTANVNLNDNTEITAGGKVDIAADVVESNVMFIGKQALLPTIDTTKNTQIGLGGSVGVQNAYNNSKVQVMKGAKITAGSIDIGTDNDILNIGLIYGGSQTSKLGITGMVSYMGGTSNAKTLVDNDVDFTATKKVEHVNTGEKDKYGRYIYEDRAVTSGAINITANNNANVINIVGAAMQSEGSSVGVSTGVISYDVHTLAKVEKQKSSTENQKGTLKANSIHVDAVTDGTINNITVAGSINSKTENANAAAGGVNVAAGGGRAAAGNGGVVGAALNPEGQADAKVKLDAVGSVSWNYVVDETEAKLDDVDITLKAPEFGAWVQTKDMSTAVKVTAEDKSYIGAYSGAMALAKLGREDTTRFSGSLAGAVAVNDLTKATKAVFSNVQASGKIADVQNSAVNSGVQVATGLSLGLEIGKRGDGVAINLAASGSANYIDSTVQASMIDNELTGQKMTVNNTAYDKDVQVAGGVTAEFAGATASVGAAVTVNQAKNNIRAAMQNNTITAGSVKNIAASKLTQVGTAVSVGVATGDKAYATLNAAVADNEVNNTIYSYIDGGSIAAGSISVEAKDGKLSEQETENKYVQELSTTPGSMTYIEGTDSESKPTTKKIYDLDGSEALKEANGTNGADMNVSVTGAQDAEQSNYTNTNIELTNKGNTIVGVALGLGVKAGDSGKLNGTGAAATVISNVKNNFTAKASNTTLVTTPKTSPAADGATKVIAASDTRMVGVAAGVAVGADMGEKPSLALSGSGVKQKINNDTTASVIDARVTASELDIQATTASSLVSVAGQVSAETSQKGVAGGLTWAENELKNTTGAYAKGLSLQAADGSVTSLDILADNKAKIIAVGAGLSGSLGYAAAAGAYASNHGTNDTEAIVDKSVSGNKNILTTVQSVAVNAKDNSVEKAVAGTLTGTGGMKAAATLGGAVSYNNIGKSAADKQKVVAKLNNTDIITAENGTIAVSAQNTADFLNLALGGIAMGGDGEIGVTAQGSVATSSIYTDTYAGMEGTNVNQSAAHKNAQLTITADSTAKTVNSADLLNVNIGSGVDIAASGAVSLVRSDADTNAKIKDSKLKLQDVTAQAQSKNELLNIAIGLGVGASLNEAGIAAAANIVNNRINNDTLLTVDGSTLDANGTAALLANSREQLRNYGGAISIGASGGNAGVAVGVTVVTNTINSDTTAIVNNSNIDAAGNGNGVELTEYEVVNDGSGDESKDAVKNYQKHKVQDKEVTKKGLIVSADALHELSNVSITAGVGASATAGVAADATVVLNDISGKTSAEVNKTDINKSLSDLSKADLFVSAYDKADISSHLGTLSVGAAGTAGVGAAGAGDRNTLSREVTAKIANAADNKKVLNAHDAAVQALGQTKLYISESGLGVGASGTGAAAVTGSVSSDSLTGNTTALVTGVSGKVHSLAVYAERLAKVAAYNNAISLSGSYGSGSVSVGVTNIEDTSHTNAELSNAELDAVDTSAGSVKVLANNHTELGTELSGDALAISIGGAAGISVLNANIESQVGTKLSNAKLGQNKKFDDVSIKAFNDVYSWYRNVGVDASSLVGIGVGKGAININTGTTSEVLDSKAYATKAITVSAEEKRTIDAEMVGVTVGAAAVGVNVLYTNIGTDLKDNYSYETGADSGSATGSYGTSDFRGYVNDALKRLNEQAELAREKTGDDSIKQGSSTINKGHINAEGIKTTVNKSELKAGSKLDIGAKAITNTQLNIHQASVGIGNVSVAANRVDVEDKLGVDIDKALLEGSELGISTLTDGKIASYTGQGGVSGASYADTTGYVLHHGKNLISIDGSTLKSTDSELAISAANKLKLDNTGFGLSISGLATGRLVLESEDASEAAVELGKNSKKENTIEAASVTVTAQNAPKVRTENKAAVDVSLFAGAGSLVVSKATGKASLEVTGSNSFKGASTVLKAQTGGNPDNGSYTLEAINHAVGVTGGSITVDKARTINSMEASTKLGAAKFADGAAYGSVSAGALNAATSHTYITTTKIGLGVASSSNFAQSYENSKVSMSLDTGADTLRVKNLEVYASNSADNLIKADGSSAGLLAISPYLSKVENTVNSMTTTTIKGNITADGTITAQAIRADEYNLKSDSLTVTAAGGGAAGVENKITNNTELNIENAELKSAADVLLDLENSTLMNQKDGFEQMVSGSGVGLVDVDCSAVNNTLTSNAQLNLASTKIFTDGSIRLISHNDEQLKVNNYVYNVSLAGGAEARIKNELTNNDKITLKDSELKTQKVGKDITISAADDLKLYTYAYAETSTGAVNGANALMTNNLTRNNILDMSAGANNLYSTQDIRLYAGKNADGSLGLFDLNAVAADFIGAVIPVAIMPSVDNTIQQNNQITLGSGSSSRSVRHTDIYAAQGREMANVYANRYVGIYGTSEKGSFVTTDKGKTINGKTANNFVKIDGSAVAGVANKIDIVIGDAGDIVILDKNLRDTVSGAKDKSDITISVNADASTGLTSDSLSFGTEDYANTLYKRYEEVNNLMLEYAKDGADSKAYQGYKAEAERIKNEMLSLGLAELDGKGSLVKKDILSVDYVEIPELTGSGGNITVDTDDFNGSGEVKAQGTPEINITNNTNLMTKINSVIVDDPGGKLVFNGTVVTGKDKEEFNNNISALNKGSSAYFKIVEAADGQSGKISINGNYNGSRINYKGSIYDDTKKQLVDVVGSMKPLANILIQGNIYSNDGAVSIKSAHDSIVIQGRSAKDAIAVSGATVALEAANGNITQGYTDGIVNIGADVRSQYDQKYKDAISQDKGTHSVDKITTTIEDGSEAKGSYIAGGSVYINAADINVNGVIQSGFGDYYADISDQTTQAAINRINNAYDGQRELSDAAVTTGDQYKIINGGAIWDAKEGCYKYRLNVYYNPTTKKILVQNVDAGGGRVYLTGRISSTGNGQIICLDGVSNINVKNTTQYGLQLGDLTTQDVSGLVRIQDTAKKTLTEITNGKATVKAIDDKGQIGSIKSSSSFNKSEGYNYNPLTGLKYTWTTGDESMSYEKYSHEEVTGGWNIEWSASERDKQLAEWTEKLEPDSKGTPAGEKRPDGQTIRVDNSGDKSTVTVSQTVTSDDDPTLDREERWSTGLWGYYKHTKMYWTKATGTRKTYDASIKADNPINVKFIGNEANNGVINVSSNTSIELAGNVGNTKLYETKNNNVITGREEKGTLNISSRDGSLVQSGGALYGENIKLVARKDIENINIVAGDVVNLSAVQDATDKSLLEQNKIDLEVKAGYLAKGNVVLGNVGSVVAETKDGKMSYKPLENSTGITGLVKIKTTGNEGSISQKNGSVSIVADKIDLTSNNGAVYGQKQADGSYTALKLYAGQQPIGLDTLDASVNAKAKGDISLEQTAGDLRIGQIISTDGDVSLTVAKGSVVDALPYVSNDRGDADDLVERWRSLGLIDGNDAMQKAKDDLNAYADKHIEGSKLGKYQKWDENALLYAISDSVVNQTSENLPKTSEKAPNVIGHNITINVADSVGLNSGKQTRINMMTLLAKDSSGSYLHLDDLKALSKADASMVTWEDGGKTAVITEKLPIGVQQTTKTKLNKDGTTTLINGSLTLKSAATAGGNGDIFLEGRDKKLDAALVTAATKDLYLGSVVTKIGDVTLSSLGGIYNNAAGSTEPLITGSSLFMTAANGSLGTADKKLTTNIFGTDKTNAGLNAVAAGGVYVDQKGSNALILRSISSGGAIYLGADKSMFMGEVNGTAAVNYVRAENNGVITLEARGGSLGEAAYEQDGTLLRKSNKGIRILNAADENGSKVTLRAQDNVFVTGVASEDGKTASSSGDAGVLNLTVGATTDAGLQNVGIVVDGALRLSGDLISSSTASVYTAADLYNSNNISSADSYLGSAKSIYVSGNNKKLVGTDRLTLDAGSDVESDNVVLQSKKLVVNAGRDIRLKNVELATAAAKLTAQNDINYHNEKSELNIGTGTEMTAKTISLQADAEGIIANGTFEANTIALTAEKTISQTAGSIIAQDTIAKAEKGGLFLLSEGNKLQNVTVDAQNDSAVITNANDAAGDLHIMAVGEVGGNLQIDNLANGTANDVVIDSELKAKWNIIVNNKEADIKLVNGADLSGSSIYLDAKEDIVHSAGNIAADNKVKFNAGKNIINNAGSIKSELDDVLLTAQNNVLYNGGSIEATSADLNAGNDLTMTGGTLNATTANLTAGNAINQTAGSIIAKDTVAKAVKGGLFLRSESNKLQNVTVDAQNDSAIITSANDTADDLHVTTVGEVGGNLELNDLANGTANNIVIDSALKAKWNIIVNNKEADIKIVNGADISGNSIYLDAKEDILHDAGNIAADNKVKFNAGKDIINNAGVITTEFDDVTLTAQGNMFYNGGSIEATSASITAGNNLMMADGTLKAATANLAAGNTLEQIAGSIIAQNTVAKAGANLSLASRTNRLQNVSVDAQNGSATIVSANDAAGDLNVTTVGVVGKDLSITNLANGEANAIKFDKNLQAGGNVTITNEEADINVAEGTSMRAQNIALVAKNNDVSFNGGDVKVSEKLSAEAKNIAVSGGDLEAESAAFNAGENVAVSGGTLKATTANINAGNNLTMSGGTLNATTANLIAGNAINQTAGSIIAKDTVAKAVKGGLFLRSESNKLQNVTVDAQNDSVVITSANDVAGNLHVTTVDEVGGNLQIDNLANGAANDVVIDGTLKAKWNIIVNNQAADIRVADGADISGNSIYLDAKRNILHDAGNIAADNKVKLTAGKDIINNAGVITTEFDDVILTAQGNVLYDGGSIETKQNVAITADKDVMFKAGSVVAKQTTLTAMKDVMQSGGTVEATSADISAGDDLKMTGGTLKATTVSLTAGNTLEQMAGSIIARNTLAKAGADLSLASRTNRLQNVSVDAQHGSATVVSANDAAGELNVTTVGVVGKDLSITNLANGEANAIKFDKNLQAGGKLTITNEEADINVAAGTNMRAQNIALVAQANDISFNGGKVTAGEKLSAEAQNVAVNSGELKAGNTVLTAVKNVMQSGGTVEATSADISAGNDLKMSGGTLKATTVSLTAGNALMQAAGSISAKDTLAKAVNGGLFLLSESNKLQNVTVDAHNDSAVITSANNVAGDLHVTTVGEVGGNLQIDNLANGAANDVLIDGTLKAKWNIIVNNKEADINITKEADISGSSIYINAKEDILHNAGKIAADNKVTLIAGNTLEQTAGSIIAQNTLAKAGTDLSLASRTNKLQNVSVEAKNGSATIVSANDAADDLNITTVDVVGKDLSITNLANGEANDVVVDSALKAKGSISITNKEAAINVVQGAELTAENVTFDAQGNILHKGGIIAVAEKMDWETDGNILLQQGSLTAKNMDMLAVGYIDETYDNTDTATAASSYTLNVSDTLEVLAGGSNTADGKNYGVDLGSRYNKLHKVIMDADNGNIIIGNVGDADLELSVQSGQIVKGNIDIHNWQSGAANDVIVNGSLQAEGNINIVNNEKDIIVKAPDGGVVKGKTISFIAAGSIENNNAITAKADVSLGAHEKIINMGNIASGKDVLLITEDDAIINKGSVNAGSGVTINAADDLLNVGNIKAESAVEINAVKILLNNGSIKSGADITVTSKTSDLINFGNYYTDNGTIRLTAQEDILNLGVMETAQGNIEINSENGSIYNQQGADLLTGAGDIILHAKRKDEVHYYYNDKGELVRVVGAIIKHYTDKDKFGGQYIEINGKKYDVVKNGSVFNAGDALAMNGTIRFISDYGDVTNYDDFATLSTANPDIFDTKYNGYSIATSNVEISAKNGTLFNSKDIEAGGDVTLTAAYGLTNFAYNVYAGKNISLTATQGDLFNSATLESYAGDVTLRAENGNVINGIEGQGKGDIITYGGNVTLSANGYAADGKAGSVTNYGDIIAINVNAEDKAAAGSITLISEHGDVDNFDDFNTYKQDGQYYKDYDASRHGSIKSKDASYNLANNNLTISAKEGHVYTDKDYLVALGNVSLEAKTGLESFGKIIYAGKDITLKATEGNLFNQAELLSVEGDIKLKAENGTVANLVGGDLIAKNGSVMLEAGAEADNALHYVDAVGNVHDLSAAQAGDNIIKSRQYYKDTTGEWIEISKTTDSEVVIPAAASEFKTEVYYLDAADKDHRNKEVLLTTISGDRSTGLAEAFRTGDVINRGDIAAQGAAAEGKGAVTLHSQHGNVMNYDNFRLLNNQKSYDYLGKTGGTHNAYVNGLLKEITARFNPDSKYAYDEKGILLSDSDMNIIADEGYLYNNMNIVSDRDVNLTSGKTLTIGTNVSAVIAKGDVVVRSLKGSVINDGHVESGDKNIIIDGYTGVVSEVGAANLKALNGSISVVSIYGDINVDELFAGEMAVAGTKQGNIKLGAIGGKDVILYTEDKDAVIRGYDKNAADQEHDEAPMKINVEDHLFLQGNNFGEIDIDRSKNTGTLVVDANGIGGVMQGMLKLNMEGDVRFTTLNVTNADITVGGKLGIDRLHVAGKGIITSQGYVTGVYGVAPVHDASNALYFDLGDGRGEGSGLRLTADEFRAESEGGAAEVRALETMRELHNKLDEAGKAEETFGKDNNGWMNLYVDGPRDQRSNGLLLHIDTYYHSANQRWSAEDLITKLVDFKPVMSYNAHFGDAYGMFARYNIIELPEKDEEQV